MNSSMFGFAWVTFALALAVHIADEATHDFLSVYNPIARDLRRRLHVPIPSFSLPVWIGGLIAGVVLLLLLAPLAFGGSIHLRVIAWPLAIFVGIGNALLHAVGSLRYRRPLPGMLSAPLLLAAGIFLLWSA